MSEIPKNRRKKSKLDIQHNIYKIRKELTSNLMETFAYSEKKFEQHIRAVTDGIKDPEERKKRADLIREREEGFDLMFIQLYTSGLCFHRTAMGNCEQLQVMDREALEDHELATNLFYEPALPGII